MASMQFSMRVSYISIGNTHLLIRFNSKLFKRWMLYDLEEIAQETGVSVEELFRRFREKSA